MSRLLAITILIACCRLWLAAGEGPTSIEISEAHGHDVSHHTKVVEDDWLHAFEGVMNGSSSSSNEPGRRFFKRIMEEVEGQQYEAAAAGFRLFRELHPTSPLVDQAEYWLGECEYQLGRYRDAIESFDHALSRVPLHPQLAAAAFLRQGNSYAKLGDEQHSRNLMELLVAQFPTTQEATLARQALLKP